MDGGLFGNQAVASLTFLAALAAAGAAPVMHSVIVVYEEPTAHSVTNPCISYDSGRWSWVGTIAAVYAIILHIAVVAIYLRITRALQKHKTS